MGGLYENIKILYVVMKNIVVIICLLISVILACENMCSGHGVCQKKDKCECYPGWGAADCSERI